MIEFKNAVLQYGETVILTINDLILPQGTLLPVIGKNGSGKTSLIRAVAQCIPAKGIYTQGRIVYQPQAPYIFHTTCEKNILSAMECPDKSTMQKLLCQVGLCGFSAKKAYQLSGGERARLALARTLAAKADIYLIDEPFAAVDEASASALALLLKDHCLKRNATLLMPIHHLKLAAQISSQVLLVQNGQAQLLPLQEARESCLTTLLEDYQLC